MQWLLQFAKYLKGRIVQFSWDQTHFEKTIAQFHLPQPLTFQIIKIRSSIFHLQLPSDVIFFMIKLIYKNESTTNKLGIYSQLKLT